MPLVSVPHPLTGGIETSSISCRANDASFYDMLNFRQSPYTRGRIEQTPWWTILETIAQGTYWDGAASAAEPAASAVRLFNVHSDIRVTDYCVFGPSGQRQVFYQVTVPAAENVNTGCSLVIENVTALAITLGSTFDVEIDGATTFRWRKNGGAWTGLQPCAITGTSVDGGNATVYFLATSGFTIGDLWQWRRTDASFQGANALGRPCEWVYHKNKLYFTSNDYRVMKLESPYNAANTTLQYAISVGYRPVYGTYFTFYDDHLVVGGFSKTYVTYTESNRIRTIGWSDKFDYENFIPTDTNEADQYTLPTLSKIDTVPSTPPNSQINGVFVYNKQLYVSTTREIYSTIAYGLPLVFVFQLFAPFPVYGTDFPVTVTPVGVFLITYRDVVLFDGAQFKSLNYPLTLIGATSSVSGISGRTFGVFNEYTQEFSFANATTLMTYQVKYGTWSRRGIDFNGEVQRATCIYVYEETMRLGSHSRIIYRETTGTQAPVYDSASGTAYTNPKITLHANAFTGRLCEVKEISGTYIGLACVDSSTTYYSTDTNLQVKLHWYVSSDGLVPFVTPSTHSEAVIVVGQDGWISYPRASFRAIALEIQINGLQATKPPYRALITAIEPNVRINDQYVIRK